ncbi:MULTISPECIES: hypothetical protein [Xanthomonas]|uniref:hypothetical protein n=1 Tax=Xanthomonas TaxID=338 RepID=UPI0007ED56E8|nr:MULTISPECIES: hypothetical protein [Xanthomonas]MCE4305497.1 hypothetical protein [Xanthomonas hortorum pv. vitians]MCE4311519.1 hypothetical protein [Xanthomonas hortorum pv. vitians]MCE4336546.1 hypothetical protein [Xanthomonas hortorum pv. vitians]MCE4344070.1 hypothetical protein [Xanthomonas hortorum pv. vitians]MCE4508140.1 hypothetical protein [Xanthomonas hortorum pv. vitians]
MNQGINALKSDFLHRVGHRWRRATNDNREQLLTSLSEIFDRFHDLGLADPQFPQILALGNENEHQQRMAEMLLAKHLWDHGFTLTSSREGPDFRARKDNVSVWIELVTPEPVGIDPGWLAPQQNGVWSYPHREIALRYTSALKEKYEKLVGANKSRSGYLKKGIVGLAEPYVIAINQHLLQGSFRTLDGISQIPTACEVLYGVGPQQMHLDSTTGQARRLDHSHRPGLTKVHSDGGTVTVPAESFLNRDYAPVSAVFALDLQEEALVTPAPDAQKKCHLAAVIYNVAALNPIPPRFLPGQEHWTAKTTKSVIKLIKI